MRIGSFAILLLLGPALVDAAPRPEAGDYIFAVSHAVEVCRRSDAEGHCIESDRKAFGFEEKIQVQEFSWDAKAGEWTATVSALGRSHAIPMSVLHKHSACDRLMDGYREGLSRAPKDCRQDPDCALFPSPWNSCLPPQAARSSRKLDALLKNSLAAIPGGGCLILHPPCAAVPPGEARCVQSRCENVDVGFGRGRFRGKAGRIEGASDEAQPSDAIQPGPPAGRAPAAPAPVCEVVARVLGVDRAVHESPLRPGVKVEHHRLRLQFLSIRAVEGAEGCGRAYLREVSAAGLPILTSEEFAKKPVRKGQRIKARLEFRGDEAFNGYFLSDIAISASKAEGRSYLACGCGCCPGVAPLKKCLDPAADGGLERIEREDRQARRNPDCALMGCSRGIEHRTCD